MSRPVETVAVVGRDAAAWLTALALWRAFGRSGLKVEVVEAPSLLAPADAFATLPTLQGLHRLLGIEEHDLLTACAAVPVLAQRFSNWGRSAKPFLHAYDTQGAPFDHVAFLQYWLRAREGGMKVDLEDFSLGASAAKQGRQLVHSEETEGFSNAAYGYHLSARPYVELLRRRAVRQGVSHRQGQVAHLQIDGARIAAAMLADGTRVEADLFVDATGSEAALIGRMPGDSFESWGRWLPCNRLLTASGQRLRPMPGFSEISALRPGWLGLHPLQDRTAMVAVYDGDLASDVEIAQAASVVSGLRIEGPVTVSEFRPGARARPWIGNCVAIGEGAACLEPLDAAALHLTHIGVSHLVTHFPVDAERMPEAAVYNQGVAAHAANLRDFQIAHYKLNRRYDEPLWDRAREAEAPASLAYKLSLFEARGLVALYDDETFQEESWNALLIGHGLTPRSHDPLADRLPQAEQVQQFQRILRFIAAEVGEMPSLEAHLDLYGGPSSQAAF